MKALVFDAEQRTARVRDIPMPKPSGHEILVRVIAVSLSLIDPFHVSNIRLV